MLKANPRGIYERDGGLRVRPCCGCYFRRLPVEEDRLDRERCAGNGRTGWVSYQLEGEVYRSRGWCLKR